MSYSYLFTLYDLLRHHYIIYSIITLIFSYITYKITKNNFGFIMGFFILVFIGFTYAIYPLWFLSLTAGVMLSVGVLTEGKKLLGRNLF